MSGEELGIDLCSLHDAQSRDWKLDVSLPILWIDLLPKVQLTVQAYLEAGDSLPGELRDWMLSPGMARARLLPLKTFVDAWNAGPLARDVGPRHHVAAEPLSRVKLLVEATESSARWRNVRKIEPSHTLSKGACIG